MSAGRARINHAIPVTIRLGFFAQSDQPRPDITSAPWKVRQSTTDASLLLAKLDYPVGHRFHEDHPQGRNRNLPHESNSVVCLAKRIAVNAQILRHSFVLNVNDQICFQRRR